VTARDFFRAVSLVSACGPGVLFLGPVRSADAPPSPPSKEGEKGSAGSVGAKSRGGVRVGTLGSRRPPQSSPPIGGRQDVGGAVARGTSSAPAPPGKSPGDAVIIGVGRHGDDVEVSPRRGVRPPRRELSPVTFHLWPLARSQGRPPRRHGSGRGCPSRYEFIAKAGALPGRRPHKPRWGPAVLRVARRLCLLPRAWLDPP